MVPGRHLTQWSLLADSLILEVVVKQGAGSLLPRARGLDFSSCAMAPAGSRRGSKRAVVAISRSILVIVWHLLSDPEPDFWLLSVTVPPEGQGPEGSRRFRSNQAPLLLHSVEHNRKRQ